MLYQKESSRDSITFQSDAWLENWIELGIVFTLMERWEASNERIGIIHDNINVTQAVLDVATDYAMGDYEVYRDIGIAARKEYGAEPHVSTLAIINANK